MSEDYTKKLREFLLLYRVEGNESPISHVNMTGGKWSIPLEKNEEFLTYYYETLKEKKQKMYMCECFLPGKKIKLVLDIEIRPDYITGDISFEKIQYEIVPKIINTMTELLKEKLCIENIEYLISSRAPYLYHINFPNVILGIKTAKNLILICREIMEKHYQDINWNKSIDTEIYSFGKSLRMLGSYSRKEVLKTENPFYRVLKDNIPEQYLDIDLSHLKNTSIRTEIDDDQIIDITSHQEELVRHEEEIDNHDEIISSYIDEIRPQFKTLGLQVSKIKKFYYGNIDQPYFVVNLKDRLCPFVKREHRRKSDYLYIFITKNGSCLRCYNEECREHKFPDKLMKINTTIKNKYYQNFEPPKKEEEIPDGYELTDEIKQLIEKCLIEITHYDLATLVYIIYKDKFRVDTFSSSGSRTTWYEFKNHRFYADSNHLGILISEDLIYYFKRYKIDICGGTNLVIDDLVKKLKTVSFKNSVLIEASNIFYDRHQEFVSLMDTKKNLICFNNGIYDLEALEFRKGKIEDYITLSTRNEFLEYDPEHPKIKEVMNFFREVFVNAETREYILKKIALSLSGRGQEEFHIWTGNGSNGKSCVCALIKIAFGDYWNEMPVALITKPRNSSSSPSPEVMDLKGRRISTIQEPEMKDRLNMGLVKQFTGNDTISARQLHKKQEKFNLQTHLFLCCNVIPKIECSDGGTWRRIKIVEFKSKFVDIPDPNKDHEFKKDPFLDKKMASWGPYFLSLLVHYYKLAIKEGVKEPIEVKEFTQEFRKDSDFFAQFVDDCLLDDGKSITKFIEIFNLFENWCVDNNIRTKIYTKTEIKKLLKDLFGSEKAYKLGDDYVKGFRIAIKKPESVLSDEE